MGESIFGKTGQSPSGGGKSIFASGKTPSKKKRGGVGGFLGNVAGDVKEITYGAVPGLINTVGNVSKDLEEAGAALGPRSGGDLDFDRTKALGKGIADTYAKNYGSMAGFKKALYNDPLFIALDALTVLSGGTTAAAKTGLVTSKAGKTVALAAGPKPVVKTLARNELRAQFQAATARAKNAEIRVGDKVVRQPGIAAAKIVAKRERRHDVNVRAQSQQYDVALRKLKRNPEKVATWLLAKFDRQSLDAWLAHLDTVDTEVSVDARKIVRDARVQQLFDNPTPKMLKVIEEARPLGAKQAGLTGITDDVAEAARFRPARVAEGARFNKNPVDVIEESIPAAAKVPSGVLYHGSPEGIIGTIDPTYHTKTWKEGIGFYITESPEKAKLYAQGRTASKDRKAGGGGLNYVKLKPGTKVLDLDAPADMDLWRGIARDAGWKDADFDEYIASYAGKSPTNWRVRDELMDAFRDQFGHETSYLLEDALSIRGIQATTHIEGRNSTPHRVWVVKDASALERHGGNNLSDLEPTTTSRAVPAAPRYEGGPSIEELKARGLDPVYMPDTSSKPVTAPYGGKSGGIGVTLPTGNMKTNRASLQLAGQLIMDPAVLNKSFLQAAKYAHYSNIHDRLLEHAVVVEALPQGWTFIRKKRSDRVDPLDKMRPDFEEWAKSNLDDTGDWKNKESGLTSVDRADAWTKDGGYLAVPNAIAKALAGEFTRQNRFFFLMNKYPMRVWRAIVLGLRPAYLVNNMIGNTMLYLAHSGKPGDLRQLAGAFKQFVRKDQHGQIDALLQKHFAGQVRGGFVATQMPTFAPKSRGLQILAAGVNAIPSLDRRWEQALRRAKVKAELKRHPALREHANRMGKETEFFQEIEKILDDNPLVVEQVYDRVNDALGDYDNMAAWEKGTMRNLFPFYAWYKAIVGVSAKLTIEQPLKVNLVAQLAKIAVENNLVEAGWSREDVPSSALGFLPGGKDPDGRVRGFNTAPINPSATVGQLVEFGEALLPGGKRAGPFAPGLNPLLTDVIGYLTGKNLAGYSTPNVPGVGTLDMLPPARLLGAFEAKYGIDIPGIKPAPDGDTFNDRDLLDEILRFLGVPYARVSPSAAKRVASR